MNGLKPNDSAHLIADHLFRRTELRLHRAQHLKRLRLHLQHLLERFYQLSRYVVLDERLVIHALLAFDHDFTFDMDCVSA